MRSSMAAWKNFSAGFRMDILDSTKKLILFTICYVSLSTCSRTNFFQKKRARISRQNRMTKLLFNTSSTKGYLCILTLSSFPFPASPSFLFSTSSSFGYSSFPSSLSILIPVYYRIALTSLYFLTRLRMT